MQPSTCAAGSGTPGPERPGTVHNAGRAQLQPADPCRQRRGHAPTSLPRLAATVGGLAPLGASQDHHDAHRPCADPIAAGRLPVSGIPRFSGPRRCTIAGVMPAPALSRPSCARARGPARGRGWTHVDPTRARSARRGAPSGPRQALRRRGPVALNPALRHALEGVRQPVGDAYQGRLSGRARRRRGRSRPSRRLLSPPGQPDRRVAASSTRSLPGRSTLAPRSSAWRGVGSCQPRQIARRRRPMQTRAPTTASRSDASPSW